jgi:hypothetical protein
VRRRPGRGLVAGALLLGAAGCSSQSADALGQEACRHVDRALALYARASHERPDRARADRAAALGELRLALAPASLAGSGGGSWQALMATLSESSRVPARYLVTALRAQCPERASAARAAPSRVSPGRTQTASVSKSRMPPVMPATLSTTT